jgi:HEAT repeat protein
MIDDLIRRGESSGLSATRLATSIARLQPVLRNLEFGEQPRYDELRPQELRELGPEIDFIVRHLAHSGAADQRIAGYHLMGVIGRDDFIDDLEAGLESDHQWERIEAVRALGRMSQPRAASLLRDAAHKHPDLQTRRAAIEARRN